MATARLVLDFLNVFCGVVCFFSSLSLGKSADAAFQREDYATSTRLNTASGLAMVAAVVNVFLGLR